MDTLGILTGILQGDFISRFGVGDTWALYFRSYILVAHDIISEDEILITKGLKDNYPSYQNCVDQDYISKSAVVAAHMRKEVVGLKLDQVGNLTIEFAGDSKLIIPATVDIVDWQWCLNRTGNDPYQDYYVACFGQGEIRVNQEYSS
ncbi:hypothetical protein [Hymenobacter volaticus]|uniref:Uncharacterized protein n=1 Tax=Hymenobacter volaticus TaxID=2932254 RepID=A0ABY4GBR9_9BACT|nr:hypothetical protein [Hymenobacter volaticus]UOQ68176.1 hypothetical protein MUN86_10180 [Hymenobacter volaticus]